MSCVPDSLLLMQPVPILRMAAYLEARSWYYTSSLASAPGMHVAISSAAEAETSPG